MKADELVNDVLRERKNIQLAYKEAIIFRCKDEFMTKLVKQMKASILKGD